MNAKLLYTSKMFKESVKAVGFKQEYIEKNMPEDNGDIESFHNSIKTDYIWTNEFRMYEEANRSIKEAYRDYNEERPHSTIEYMSPNEFIERWNVDKNFRERYLNSLDKERERRMKRMEKRYKATKDREEVRINV